MSGDAFDARWRDVLDGERAAARARDRAGGRWLRQVAAEDATLVGVLVALAECGAVVQLRTAGARMHTGVVVAVGEDFCTLVSDAAVVHVRLSALAWVRPVAGGGPAMGGEGPRRRGASRFADVLAAAAEERDRVHLAVAGDVVVGDLVAAGRDILALRRTDDRDDVCYIASSAVDECSRLGSG